MSRLKFEFVVKASEDPKTNVICITSITDDEKNVFAIPEHLHAVRLHDKITKTQTFQKVRATLQKRHEKRQVWITLTPETYNDYVDEDGNMQFGGYLLEEVTSKTKQQTSSTETSVDALTKILENITEIKKNSNQCNLRELSEKVVIEKFSRKTSSVLQWMAIFVAECMHVGINEDTQKIEITTNNNN